MRGRRNEGLSQREGWSAHVAAPSVQQSVALLCWTPGSKSSLCAYPHVLLCLQCITTMSKWIENYVKECTKCQQNKPLTHRMPTPQYKINVPPFTQPFKVILMDLITQLPNSHGHDTILTIVDHGCTRAALFLPCTTNITGEGMAKLYLDNMYKWFGIPSKIISDWDSRFMSHFSSALCQHLGINQNISTAYHPQTNGLSEKKNQWVEQYPQFVTSASQDNWSNWLAIATAVHNNYPNTTTHIALIEALLGYSPQITMELPYPPTTVQLVDN